VSNPSDPGRPARPPTMRPPAATPTGSSIEPAPGNEGRNEGRASQAPLGRPSAGLRVARPSEMPGRATSRPSAIQRITEAGEFARGTVAPAVAAFRDPARLTARLWLHALRNDRRARAATAALAGLGIVALIGALSPPLVGRAEEVLRAPSAVHPFGTDVIGRDVLMALVQGAVPTLAGGLVAAMIAQAIGVAFGALAGFLRGPVDAALHRFIEALHAVPSLLLVLVLQAVAPTPGSMTILAAIVATRWVESARVVRADVLRMMGMDHVVAARALGASPSRILARHVLPGAISSALVLTAFSFGAVVVIETAVAALSIGTVDVLAWGSLFAQARGHLEAWWLVFFPGLFVAVTVGATILLGEAMRDALDPRLRGGEPRGG
jgi:ABC-type dipeptide/oligopeptide/nickel transport system permease subunit